MPAKQAISLPPPPADDGEGQVANTATPFVTQPQEYAKEDYFTSAPYEEVYSCRKEPFLHQRMLEQLAERARRVGFTGFKKLYAEFSKSRDLQQSTVYANSVTEFAGQPIELDAGEWQAGEMGIVREGTGGEVLACVHPILPVERLVNIDTGTEKLKLAFRKGSKKSHWREVIVDKSVLASPQKILALADLGVAVTSETAKALISFLHDVENLNYERIPERKSTSRLGYIEGEGFSPYVEGLVFDGNANFRAAFAAIQQAGSRDAWLAQMGEIRSGSVMARIALAASFASVLVAPVGTLPFFVHLWGGESGTGKTVALMIAASVWANPEMGKYIQTFNSTTNGRELLAGFFNHLPMIVDEMQLAKDARGKSHFNVYELAEGVGKTRANKALGVNRTTTWANCILTTGESPLVGESGGAGAVNRIIEMECHYGETIVKQGHKVVSVIKKNYGWAGQEFVERLYSEDGVERAQQTYQNFFTVLEQNDTTEKQAMAAAIILTADHLATEWIFQDDRQLTAGELSQFLASRASVNVGYRAYQYMQSWVAMNRNRLETSTPGEIYGTYDDIDIDEQVAYIIAGVFRKVLEDEGYAPRAVLSYMKEKGIIITRGRHNTMCKRINGTNTECVAMRMNLLENGGIEVPSDEGPWK